MGEDSKSHLANSWVLFVQSRQLEMVDEFGKIKGLVYLIV